MKTKIKVTQEHWDRGKAADGVTACTCVVAQALQDAGFARPFVGLMDANIGMRRRNTVDLPFEARNLVAAFDGRDHKPFELPLEFDFDATPEDV